MRVATLATAEAVEATLLGAVSAVARPPLACFLAALHKVYVDLAFTYLEINPVVVLADGQVTPLDLAAKVRQLKS